MEEISVRKYGPGDREAVRKICCDTAFMGQPMEMFFDDREILSDLLTSYYTDHEPESSFVAESGGKVVGYLTGCKDTAKKDDILARKIVPRVLWDFIRKGLIFRKKTAMLLANSFKSLLRGEFGGPSFHKEYPAHLHINIDKDCRGGGIGARLMDAFIGYLRDNKVGGVHLSTFSEQGRAFFLRSGFTPLWERTSSQWRYLINEDVKTSILGKRVP